MPIAPDERLAALTRWVSGLVGESAPSLVPASADASFRRYFRVAPVAPWQGRTTLIAMDAPPPMEDCRPFVHVATLLAAAGVNAPPVLAQDLDRGFLLLGDLGTVTYLDALDRAFRARPLPRRHRRADPLPAHEPRRRARALRRGAAGARARALPRLVRRPPPRRHADGSAARGARRRVRAHPRQQSRAAARVRPPRLPLAQPDGQRAESRRAGFPGRRPRTDHLRSRLAAARRLRRVGRGAPDRLGGALLGAREAGRPAGRRRLRRVLARFRVDGRAATAQGARNLRAARPSRRQDGLPRRHAARERVPARRLRPLSRARPAARTRRCRRRASGAGDGPRLADGRRRHRDDPRRRARRADAAADRHLPEAAARAARQAADRASDRSARPGRTPRHRDQRCAPRANGWSTRSATAPHSASAFTGRANPSRWKPRAASPPRFRCWHRARC